MLRSPHDRQIAALAVPALGSLAAEPLYVLADTAIVGHLGTTPLAALAIATTLLTTAFTLFNFLAYGTTPQVARLIGAGRAQEARALGTQALWLGLVVGVALLLVLLAASGPLVTLMGGEGEVEDGALTYLRISALGAPAFMVAVAAQGYLRGVGDLRTPLIVLVVSQVVNIVLELWFVYGLDLGLAGSAAGTVIAQVGMGVAFVALLRPPRGARRPVPRAWVPMVGVGAHIAVRTGSLLLAFGVAGAVLARVGPPSLAAHQVAFQLFVFLALVLDAIAIAGQVLVGRALGAGDPGTAIAASWRMIGWSVVFGTAFGLVLLAGTDVIPRLFTPDAAVLDRAAALWPVFVATMPFNGAVFALDGILLGAGDTRFIAVAMVASSAVFIACALAAYAAGLGVAGVWGALAAFILARLATTGGRFLQRGWVR